MSRWEDWGRFLLLNTLEPGRHRADKHRLRPWFALRISSSPTLATAAAGRQAVAASRARELARYPAWGVLAEAKEQIQTVLAWNAIYVPYERGVIFPVIGCWPRAG